jgi:hypothetical protein
MQQNQDGEVTGTVYITPAPAPYKCSSGEVCRFPFRLHGDMHWAGVKGNL